MSSDEEGGPTDKDNEGRPFKWPTAQGKEKSVKSLAQREEVTARVVRIANQCRDRSASVDGSSGQSHDGSTGESDTSLQRRDAERGAEASAASAVLMHPYDHPRPALHQSFEFVEDTVIIFDWDDTLFPTWFITEESKGQAVSSRSKIMLPPESELAETMTEHARRVETVLRTARAVGRVGIVTLAQRPWVISSAKRFLVGIDFEALIKELKIPIVYARESIKRSMVSLAEVEEGVNVFAVAKQRAMAKALKKLYGKDLAGWRNVISVGDSRIEKDAMKELLWSIDMPDENIQPPCCKTVKLMEEPSVAQLGAELVLLSLWLPHMVHHIEDFDIIMDDSEDTMLRLDRHFRAPETAES